MTVIIKSQLNSIDIIEVKGNELKDREVHYVTNWSCYRYK